MPSNLVLGNGTLLVNFDQNLNMKDVYFPRVGQINHLGISRRNQFALWTSRGFSLLKRPDWEIEYNYREGTMAAEAIFINHHLGISMRVSDTVHYRENIYLRKVDIKNQEPTERKIHIYWCENMAAGGGRMGNSCLYLPDIRAVYHYKGPYYFLFSGTGEGAGISQYACGIRSIHDDRPVTGRDAEDGYLEGRPVADGIVDSTIGLTVDLPASGEASAFFWMAAGSSLAEVKKSHHLIKSNGPDKMAHETESFWAEWGRISDLNPCNLTPEIIKLYRRSLMIIRTQMDKGGAILAGNDSDIYEANPNAYSYLWHRDGALVANCLDLAGYLDITPAFFRFSARTLSPGGYFFQRYDPEGFPGSTWHPWLQEGREQLPIQEDETALVLWALWEHYRLGQDLELIREVYPSLIQPASRFLASYIDHQTGLPLPSYDLWEERRGVFTFTVCAVIAGLQAAASLARLFGDRESARSCQRKANKMRNALVHHLYDSELQRFLRGCYAGPGGEYSADYTLDSSLFALFAFRVFAGDDPRVARTMQAVADGLWVKTHIGGLARYQNDYYFQSCSDTSTVPGNPWIITTLWLADWYTTSAKNLAELEKARDLIEWVAQKASPTGILSEQIHPETGRPISVAPLTWSHAAFVSSVKNYTDRYLQLDTSRKPVTKI